MTWLDELRTARHRKAAELADQKDGLDGLYILTAEVGFEVPAAVEELLLPLTGDIGQTVQQILDGGKGIVLYTGYDAALPVLIVDLDSEVRTEPNPRHPEATWYPDSLPGQWWIGFEDEQPVAAHVLAYGAGRDGAIDRGTLRGSVE